MRTLYSYSTRLTSIPFCRFSAGYRLPIALSQAVKMRTNQSHHHHQQQQQQQQQQP